MTAAVDKPSYTALAQWYGSNRMLAEHVGKALKGCEWVGVPFAGGMCELGYIDARTIIASDLHRHVINLARVAQDKALGAKLRGRLRLCVMHPEQLRLAQERCRERELKAPFSLGFGERDASPPDLDWAVDYFVAVWMSRAGSAGTKKEFDGSHSVRWNAGGGDSAVRFRNAAKSLLGWQRIIERVTFVSADAFDFLDECEDTPGHGIYCDPPFPGPGDRYKYAFTEDDHRRMAGKLAKFRHARVVCRFYDVQLVRDLYPECLWKWTRLEGRKSTNEAAPEVLLINGKPRA